MKLIISNDRIAATALDEFDSTGTEQTVIAAPEGFDPARMDEYRFVDGALSGPGIWGNIEGRKAEMAHAVRSKRWAVETGGVDVMPGVRVRTDEVSQAKIAGAVQLFASDPTLERIDFEAQPGVWTTIDRNTMTSIGVAVGRHVQACFSRARVLIEAVNVAEDDAALDAIDIDAGWPGEA